MKHIIPVSLLSLAGLTAVSSRAHATVMLADCGSGGDVSIVQNKINAMVKGDTLIAAGSCAGGNLTIKGIDSIQILNLRLQDPINVNVTAATHISFTALTISGADSSVDIADHSSVTMSIATLNGWVQVRNNSSAKFTNLTLAGSGVACTSGSDCQFSSTTLTGAPSSNPMNASIGLQVGSGARLNFNSGSVTGYDWGVHVWNNATAFFDSGCGNLSIDSSRWIGLCARWRRGQIR